MSDEKLIDIQVGGLKCDAEGCDYTDTDAKMEDYEQYVNAPCPKCGAPLLTEEDMAAVKQMHEMADLINGMGPNLELGASDQVFLTAALGVLGDVSDTRVESTWATGDGLDPEVVEALENELPEGVAIDSRVQVELKMKGDGSVEFGELKTEQDDGKV
jgi:hypothetical protein